MKALRYQTGFGNEFATELEIGLLPLGQNSPQNVSQGLFAELLSGTAFTAPRHQNLRTWLYRRAPSVVSLPYQAYQLKANAREVVWLSDPNTCIVPAPNPLRWGPLPYPNEPLDFVDGMFTLAINGSAHEQRGIAIHVYLASQSMDRRAFMNADAELLLVPQEGRIHVRTECGELEVRPGEIVVIPRGMFFKVGLKDDKARGYVCENFGNAFHLPELGPIGSNGLANPRDFQYPVASVEDSAQALSSKSASSNTFKPYELIRRSSGRLWRAEQKTSPFNVLAWHGNLAPYKYDTAHFMVIGSISFDHPDPSIFTVLTSGSDTPGVANADFVIFPPRWLVAEHTFRPPWYHRNIMSEFMGLVHGQYDAKPQGFRPGGVSLHNSMVPHGPDAQAFEKASQSNLEPHHLKDTLAFMFESRYAFKVSAYAMDHPELDRDYWRCWQALA